MRSSKIIVAIFALAGVVAHIWAAAYFSEKLLLPILISAFVWTTWCCYRIWGDRRSA